MADRRRVFKVAERIRELVAGLLLQMADARFRLVTVTSVVVSPDLREAKVYWDVSGGKDKVDQIEDAFLAAAGYFRRHVAAELNIRFAPRLKFFYDDTLDTCAEVEELLSRIKEPASE